MIALEELKELSEGQRRNVEAAYHKLVADSVAGVEVDSLAVIQLLERVGRTVEQFEADCQQHEERAGRIANVAQLANLHHQLARLQAEAEALWAAEQKRREQYTATITPKLQARDALQMQVSNAEDDRRWLVSHPTQATIDAMAANERQRKAVGRQLADADDALRTWRAGHHVYVRNRESAEGDVKRSETDHHKQQLQRFQSLEANSEANGERLQARRDELQQRVTALNAELDRIITSEWAA